MPRVLKSVFWFLDIFKSCSVLQTLFRCIFSNWLDLASYLLKLLLKLVTTSSLKPSDQLLNPLQAFSSQHKVCHLKKNLMIINYNLCDFVLIVYECLFAI